MISSRSTAPSATDAPDDPGRSARPELRNVAIVAHVDHGKTTLVDAMLRQSGAFGERAELVDRVMDSGDLEREKGITILAKNTAVNWQGYTINVVDTPGHADFGGEVERGLSMVDGVVLLVDASEGPLPQTRFVLRKTLAAHLPVMLVVNKTDRADARIEEVVDESLELLLELADELDLDESVTSHLLDLPVVYASGRAGRASRIRPGDGELPDSEDLTPLIETLLDTVPPPSDDPDAPLQAHVTNLDASSFLGRIALCRIRAGVLRRGQQVAWCRADGTTPRVKITELMTTEALTRVPAEIARAGDLVAVAGISDVTIGDTLADPDNPVALPRIDVDEPAISMTIGTNTSPLAGRDPHPGKKLTARLVKNRLDAELVGNVSVRVLPTERPDTWEVQGRGELALAVLVETMRREGFELTVGKPQVVTKIVDGKIHEPFEHLSADVPEDALGVRDPAAGRAQGRDDRDGARRRPGPDGVPGPVARPDRLPHRVPDDHPRRGYRQPRVRRLRPMGRGAPHPQQGLADLRPLRPGDPLRDRPAGRPRHVVRRPDHAGLQRHGRRRVHAQRGPRGQHHPGEEADQHPRRRPRTCWSS